MQISTINHFSGISHRIIKVELSLIVSDVFWTKVTLDKTVGNKYPSTVIKSNR